MKSMFEFWKIPAMLLFTIGISNVGAWVYLIALNLIILERTGSPLAVSILYILIPIATIVTNLWAGSLIDRLNKRNLMVILDLIRAASILLLPLILFTSIWLMYVVVFFINMANSIFSPTSMVYVTKLIPKKQRKRFNSIRSLIDSGAFLLGPAIAGLLFISGSPEFAIYINGIALLLSGLVTLFIPNLEKNSITKTNDPKLSINVLKKDWYAVVHFSQRNRFTMLIYFLFSSVIVMTSAVDSLEAAFSKEVLQLSNSDYGFLVSIAGSGIVIGAFVNTLVVNKTKTSLLIGFGTIAVSSGYLIYALSTSFLIAAIGFFVLAFFLAFANTGFHTFYQNSIPVEVMGRVGSLYGFIQAILVIGSTVLFGAMAHLISIQLAVFMGSVMMLMISAILGVFILYGSRNKFFQSFDRDLNL
ncbi:MFS transporter [Halalkalibacter akibai]|uniref:MFS transporter n=1 Tax=Halalkalibacter akibai TaxID=1411 RepID=UPI00054D1DCF|nr:MFS transporter [Halalkalibacter akibai]